MAVDPAPVQFQSTHPSGVRLNYRVWRPNIVIISIHAPQWGATVFSGGVSVTGVISIHAPQWGATTVAPFSTICAIISIHAPQWGATQHHHHLGAGDQISIHAPQWGATRDGADIYQVVNSFQSTHPSGVRLSWSNVSVQCVEFQSTHPSGVRQTYGRSDYRDV